MPVTARSAAGLTLVLLAPALLSADTIRLTNGRVIEADRAWYEGAEVRYEKGGGTFGLPRTLVQSLDQKTPAATTSDPEIARARELLGRDPAEAVAVLEKALARDAHSVPALQVLAEAYLALGDFHAARQTAEAAERLDDRNAHSRALLGDALSGLGDRAGAEAAYQKSLRLHPDAAVERKLKALAGPGSAAPAHGAEFRIRYDGTVNEPLGMAVLETLTAARAEYTARLGFQPENPITVVLQTAAEFQEAHVPGWAEGINDGAIRVPVRGLERLSPRLSAVLRHELAHSFVTERTGGNCPTWLQEGIAQWLEGGDPAREDAALAAVARAGHLLPLLTLEGPFQSLSQSDAALAYAESLSSVAHILRRRGEPGVVRLLSALTDRLPSDEALPVALALSYPELQKSWDEHLRHADGK